MNRRELLSRAGTTALFAPAVAVALAGKPSEGLPPLPEAGLSVEENLKRLTAWVTPQDLLIVGIASLQGDLEGLDIDDGRRRRILARLEALMDGLSEAGDAHRDAKARALERLGY
jgi:hypothetical protein